MAGNDWWPDEDLFQFLDLHDLNDLPNHQAEQEPNLEGHEHDEHGQGLHVAASAIADGAGVQQGDLAMLLQHLALIGPGDMGMPQLFQIVDADAAMIVGGDPGIGMDYMFHLVDQGAAVIVNDAAQPDEIAFGALFEDIDGLGDNDGDGNEDNADADDNGNDNDDDDGNDNDDQPVIHIGIAEVYEHIFGGVAGDAGDA